jgi:hypothetical protein
MVCELPLSDFATMYFRTVLAVSGGVLEMMKGVCDEETTSRLLLRAGTQRRRPGSQRFGRLVAVASPQQGLRQRQLEFRANPETIQGEVA